MKRFAPSLALVLTFGLSRLAPLHAQITPVNYPTPLIGGNSVTGPITNIDPVNHMIQVKDDTGMIQTFHIDQNVQILRNGEPVQLNSLDIGDLVTITLK